MQKKQKDKMSAQVKARLLFEREIAIDASGEKPIIDDDVFKNLILRKNEMGQEREKLIRSVFILLAIAVALALEFEIKISGLDMTMGSRPYFIGILTSLASLSLMQTIITLINENAYDGLIDQVIIRKSGGGVVDPDVLKSAYQQNWMIFKILRTPFNLYDKDTIETKSFGRFAYALSEKLVLSVWFFSIVALYSTIIWLTFWHLEFDFLGWVVRLFCIYTLFVGVFVNIIVGREFEVVDALVNKSNSQEADQAL